MDKERIFKKFGGDYLADDLTYLMGIDIRFADHLASRMKDRVLLETCTGGGFSTILLAKYARHVYTVEIDLDRMNDAKHNAEIAGVSEKVTYINGDVLSDGVQRLIPEINAAFLDPDWAVSGTGHKYQFIDSNTRPPSDILLNAIIHKTPNITLVQPPFIHLDEFQDLPPHELESMYLNGSHELYCLHFGDLLKINGRSEFRVVL